MPNHITVVVGFRACGKSALCETIMASLGRTKKVRYIDMRDAILFFLDRPGSEIGNELQHHRHTMDEGGVIVDGRLVYTACLSYLKFLDRKDGVRTEHLLLAGGFRTVPEAQCFMQCGVPVTVVHITGSENDMLVGVGRRAKSGVKRPDSTDVGKLQRGWDDYQRYTLPALNLAPRRHYYQIPFRTTMRKRVEAFIGFLDLPHNVKKHMFHRITVKTHVAYKLIENLDNPPAAKTGKATALAASSADVVRGNTNTGLFVTPPPAFAGAATGQFAPPA